MSVPYRTRWGSLRGFDDGAKVMNQAIRIVVIVLRGIGYCAWKNWLLPRQHVSAGFLGQLT